MEPQTIRKTVFDKMVKNKWIEEWQEVWDAETTCHQTRAFWPDIDLESSKKVISLKREDLSKVVQIITGHGRNKYHLCVSGEITDDICRVCGKDIEDTWHLINNCSGLNEARRVFFRDGQWSGPQDAHRLPHFPIDFLFDPEAHSKEVVDATRSPSIINQRL